MYHKRQLQQRFDPKETQAEIRYHNDAICIAFSNVSRKIANEIGQELTSQLICQRYTVEWNSQMCLWLEDVDYAILYGFGTEEGIVGLLKEIAEEHGYNIVCSET